MTQMCTGFCEQYKNESITSGKARYSTGQKWCTLCAQFFLTSEIFCPCCKTRLRSKSRSKNRMYIKNFQYTK